MRVFALAAVCAMALGAQCRLPDVSPNAVERLTALELVESGHYLRAIRVLEPVARERPKDGEVAWLLSRAKTAVGDLDAGLKYAEAAVAADESIAAYHVQLAAVSGRMAEKAPLLKQFTLARRALKELDGAVVLEAANPDAQWGLMMYYYVAPALIGGDPAKSRAIGEKLGAALPHPGRYYQGRLALELKEYDRAEAFFRAAAVENPLYFDNAAALASFYIDTKPNQARAEKWACQAVHADAGRADGWALLARVYTMCGCWTEAAEVARRAELVDPENLVPWYTVAVAAINQGGPAAQAAELLRRYLSRPVEGAEPTAASAHLQLGRALEKLGRGDEAGAEFRAALELDGSLDDARAGLKRVSAKPGKRAAQP